MKSNFTTWLTVTLPFLCLAFSVFAGGAGAPAAPSSGCADDEEIRKEIAAVIKTLHVTVPNSANCGGSGGRRFHRHGHPSRVLRQVSGDCLSQG